MAGNQPSQKQIAEKYKGNLDYYKKPHYLRRWRVWTFAGVASLSVLAVLTFRYWGTEEFLSSGPISKSHAAFAHDCQVCHPGAQTDLLKTSPVAETGEVFGHLSVADPHFEDATGSALAAALQKGMASTALRFMDEACLRCHASMRLHQPQAAGLGLGTASSTVAIVHATGCAVCHREHVGRMRMALPDSQACVSCHQDAEALMRTRRLVKLANAAIAATGENRDLGDGLIRFIAQGRPAGMLPTFAGYANGHPPFGYEAPQLRDPANLKFDHARHERADIPLVKGRKLDCTGCHQPGADGAFYQPIRYAAHCQQCHSLQIQPTLPQLEIPHGDPQNVRYFLASLETSFQNAIRAEGVSAPVEIARRTAIEMEGLRRRGSHNLADLEETVFFLGDPKGEPGGPGGGNASRKFLTECAKCHAVAAGTTDRAPEIARPNIADRWVQRGPFTHVPHQHITCTDCHGAAAQSKLTSDILLPPQKTCAECHRAPVADESGWDALASSRSPQKLSVAAAQRQAGGVKWECQSCHAFHSTVDAGILSAATAPPGRDASDQASPRNTR